MAHKIGLVGCGRWGRNILRDLLALGCEVHVAEHREENRVEASEMGAYSTRSDLEDLPYALDGYVVAVQTAFHYEVLLKLADTKRPVFVEKPMVTDRGQALHIQRVMGDRVFVMHKWRYHPGVQAIADMRMSGEYGRLRSLRTRRLQWGQPHKDVDAFWVLAPHDVSIAYHIAGELGPVRYASAVANDGWVQSLTVHLEDQTSIMLEVSAIHPNNDRLICAIFDRAVISLLDSMADHLVVRFLHQDGHASEEGIKFPISTEFPLLRELRAFVNFLSGEATPMSSISEELLISDKLLEIRESANTLQQ